MALGFYLITAGNSGYERYMLQGNVSFAAFDAILAIVGMVLLARAFRAARVAL